jgi:hypothetical protein
VRTDQRWKEEEIKKGRKEERKREGTKEKEKRKCRKR